MKQESFNDYLSGLSTTLQGSKRAARIEACTYQAIDEGYTASFSCKDSTCPRCRKGKAVFLGRKFEVLARSAHEIEKVCAFATFTFRESATVAGFNREVSQRRRFIHACCIESGIGAHVLVAEFTCKGERIHLHFHSLVVGNLASFKELEQWFNAVGERNVRIEHWDGRVQELVKYFMPTLGYAEGVVMSGTRHLRIRSVYGVPKPVEEEF